MSVLDTCAKHIVLLSFTLRHVDRAHQRGFATAFVVEVADEWFLLTAGHVIKDLQGQLLAGAELLSFRLHDNHVEGRWVESIPFDFNEKSWATVVDDGTVGTKHDLACFPLSGLYKRNLAAGGIQPLSIATWGKSEPSAYDEIFLVGAPAETLVAEGAVESLKLTLLPLKEVPWPVDTSAQKGEHRLYATILDNDDGTLPVKDIAGMSGGPVFGAQYCPEGIRYWVIGIQSSWFASRRTISFCPAEPFLRIIQSASMSAAREIAADAG